MYIFHILKCSYLVIFSEQPHTRFWCADRTPHCAGFLRCAGDRTRTHIDPINCLKMILPPKRTIELPSIIEILVTGPCCSINLWKANNGDLFINLIELKIFQGFISRGRPNKFPVKLSQINSKLIYYINSNRTTLKPHP